MTVFATRGGRNLIKTLVVGTVLSLASNSAKGVVIVNYDISVLGGDTGAFNTNFNVNGVVQPNLRFLHAGGLSDGQGANEWNISYNTTSDPDPVGGASLSSGLTIENTIADNGFGATLRFTIRLTLAVLPSGLPATFGGNSTFTLGIPPGATPGLVSPVGNNPMWNGQINGVTEASLLNLAIGGSNGPATNNAGTNNIASFQKNTPINTIGILVYFDLSPGETVAFTDFFAFIPSPGALALFGLAGVFGGRRRRS